MSASTIRAPWARIRMARTSKAPPSAAPIFRDFMKGALADQPPTPFRVAQGIEEVPIDWKSGSPVPPGTPGAVLEAFKAGTAPGEANAQVRPWSARMTGPRPFPPAPPQRQAVRRPSGQRRAMWVRVLVVCTDLYVPV